MRIATPSGPERLGLILTFSSDMSLRRLCSTVFSRVLTRTRSSHISLSSTVSPSIRQQQRTILSLMGLSHGTQQVAESIKMISHESREMLDFPSIRPNPNLSIIQVILLSKLSQLSETKKVSYGQMMEQPQGHGSIQKSQVISPIASIESGNSRS